MSYIIHFTFYIPAILHDASPLLYFRYIATAEHATFKTPPKPSHVIAMSLFGSDPVYLYGAMRNAQLAPVIYPGWTLRFYMSSQPQHALPDKFVYRMKKLGAQFVSQDYNGLPPPLWRYQVMFDPLVEYYLIRDANSHLGDREQCAVEEWIRSDKAVHCMRDLPEHADRIIIDGLWGMKSKTRVGKEVQSFFQGIISDSLNKTDNLEGLLQNVFYPLFKDQILCHDSVSTHVLPNAKNFPIIDVSQRHGRVGQNYSVTMTTTTSN